MQTKNFSLLPIGCIIMASGEGRRFGGNKLLQNFQNKPLIEHLLSKVTQINFAKTIAVTRYAEIAAICKTYNIEALCHQLPGQNDTVRLGLENTYDRNLKGYIFCVADQPLLSAATLQDLCAAFLENPDYIYRTSYNNKHGNPVIFPSKYAAELMQLPQNKGGSYLLKKYPEQVRLVPVRDKYELLDIDTAEDLQHLEYLLTL